MVRGKGGGDNVAHLVIANDDLAALARTDLTDALKTVKNPCAVVIVVLGADDSHVLRARSDRAPLSDVYGRAGIVADRRSKELRGKR